MISDVNSKDGVGFCVSVTDNILSKQDALNLVTFFVRNDMCEHQVDSGYFSLKPFSFSRLMLGIGGHSLSDFKSEVIDTQMISFHCMRSKVHFVIQSDVGFDVNNCDLFEFVTSTQLLFNPVVTEIVFFSEGPNYVSCLITLKLAVG